VSKKSADRETRTHHRVDTEREDGGIERLDDTSEVREEDVSVDDAVVTVVNGLIQADNNDGHGYNERREETEDGDEGNLSHGLQPGEWQQHGSEDEDPVVICQARVGHELSHVASCSR